MKTNIVGLLYIMVSALLLFGGVLSFLSMGDSYGNPAAFFLMGIGGLSLGVFSFILGSGLRARKPWSYKAGLVTFSLVALGNLVATIFGNWISLIGVFFNAFCIYSLLSEKQLFSPTLNSVLTPPSTPPPPTGIVS